MTSQDGTLSGKNYSIKSHTMIQQTYTYSIFQQGKVSSNNGKSLAS